MSFRISTSVEEGINLVNLHDDSTKTTISIVPEVGAMLHAFRFPLRGTQHNIMDHYKSAAAIEKELTNSYRSSKLSPFPCRINEGRYEFEGRTYQFDKLFSDGSAIHGLLFNKPFRKVVQQVEPILATAAFEYDYNADDQAYPFQYRCHISYTLFPQRVLQIQTILTNTGESRIPIGDGWHPYFTLGGQVDDWLLQFPSKGMLEFNEKLIPTGRVLPFDEFNQPGEIGNRQLDNCFLLDPAAGNPVCTLSNPANGCSLSFHTDGEYPYLQLYIPPHRQNIAIENLSTAPDAFNNQLGLIILAPGEQKTLTVSYQINTGESA